MAGFNEQTLFAAPDGALVSVIRGRDHVGGIPGTNPRSSDCLFFRAESRHRGEIWSTPEPTDLGRHRRADRRLGASGRLPAGPPAVSLEPPPRPRVLRNAHGGQLRPGPHLGTDLLFDRTADGEPFDNYYNATASPITPVTFKALFRSSTN